MSGGPIQRERESHKPKIVSTPDVHRVCAQAVGRPGRGYCGRGATGAKVAADWAGTTCSDCHAAHRADQAQARRDGA